MAETLKVLAQSNPVATTLTDAYTVPGATQTIISSITVCNRSAVTTSFRISIAVGGAVDDVKQYLYYDFVIAGNMTFTFVSGITLAATDVMRVYAALATLSFNIFGAEIT
jgi:hypothetical protein